MSKRMSDEMTRRLRLGDIRKLLLDRCGRVLPDDDAGGEYLVDLLAAMSLGKDPRQGMIQASRDWAPWAWERRTNIEEVIDRILALPARQRRIKARPLGVRLRVTNEERERLGLKTIKPVDMSDEELALLRKAKKRARQRKRRQASGSVSRAEYLAASKSRAEPWKAEGICRRTWERRRKKSVASACPIKEFIPATDLRHEAPKPAASAARRDKTRQEKSAPCGAPAPSITNQIKMAVPRLCAEPEAEATDLRHQAKGTDLSHI